MGYDTAPSAIHATQIRAFARLCADNEGLIADHPQQAIQIIETGFKTLPHEDQVGIVNWIDRSLNPPTHPWMYLRFLLDDSVSRLLFWLNPSRHSLNPSRILIFDTPRADILLQK